MKRKKKKKFVLLIPIQIIWGIFLGLLKIIYNVFIRLFKKIHKYGLKKAFFFENVLLLAFLYYFLARYVVHFYEIDNYFWRKVKNYDYFNNLVLYGSLFFYLYWNIRVFIRHCHLRHQENYWWHLDGWQFEEEVATVFRRKGFKVKITKKTGDGGVDIVLSKHGENIAVQCKHYSSPVRPEPVRALWGCLTDFEATKAVLVASSGVTKVAKDFIDSKDGYFLLTLEDILKGNLPKF